MMAKLREHAHHLRRFWRMPNAFQRDMDSLSAQLNGLRLELESAHSNFVRLLRESSDLRTAIDSHMSRQEEARVADRAENLAVIERTSAATLELLELRLEFLERSVDQALCSIAPEVLQRTMRQVVEEVLEARVDLGRTANASATVTLQLLEPRLNALERKIDAAVHAVLPEVLKASMVHAVEAVLQPLQGQITRAVGRIDLASVVEAVQALLRPQLELLRTDIKSIRGEVALSEAGEIGLREYREELRSVKDASQRTFILERISTLSRAFGKSKDVIFVARGYFGDNLKYAFLDFAQRVVDHPGVHAHYLTDDPDQARIVRDAGFSAILWNEASTSEMVELLLRAKVAVSCDHFWMGGLGQGIPYALLAGAQHVALWHGIPVKKIALENIPPAVALDAHTTAILASCAEIDVLVSPGSHLDPVWRRAFRSKVRAHIGYPRNDVLFRAPTRLDLLNVDIDVLTWVREARELGQKVFLYAPTFRDHVGPSWLDRVDLRSFGEACADLGARLVVNLHPYEQSHSLVLSGRISSNTRIMAPGTDIYPLMRYADGLITDYSSLALDYLNIDRPVFLFRPDHEQYLASSRQLTHDILADIFGPAAGNIGELSGLLMTVQSEDSDASGRRQKARDTLFDYRDGDAAGRVSSLIFSLI